MRRKPHPSKAGTISLSGFSSYFGLERCLMFAERAMVRAGIEQEDLFSYQREALRDLIDPLDEDVLGAIHDPWTHNYERLMERGRRYPPEAPAKPRIDIIVEMTSKGNFKAEWVPTGHERYGFNEEPTDFVHFWRQDHRGNSYDGRPSNELFFIHGVDNCLMWLRHADFQRPTSELNTVILAACAQLVERVKRRLSYSFEVRMVTDVFTEWEDLNEHDWSRDPLDRLVKWEIDNPAERKRLAELAFLENMESELGFSEEALTRARNVLDTRPVKRGQEPSPHNYSDRLARILKKEGLPATKGSVERALVLIEKHRVNAKVIPFQR